MKKRRLAVLLAATIALAAVGGLIYSRTRGPAPDDAGVNADDIPPPAPVTKATTPARKLNEKEQMLVGKWKFENVAPGFYSPGYAATYEFGADGTFAFSFSSEYVKHWTRRGTFRVTGDIVIKEGADGKNTVNLLEDLTDSRFVISVQDGDDRLVKSWSRVR